MMLTYGSLYYMVLVRVTGGIFGVDILEKCMFALEFTIAKLLLIGKY